MDAHEKPDERDAEIEARDHGPKQDERQNEGDEAWPCELDH